MAKEEGKKTWQEQIVGALEEQGPLHFPNVEVFVYPSKSDPMAFYYVLVFPDGSAVCNCKGFRFRDECDHVKTYKKDHEEG